MSILLQQEKIVTTKEIDEYYKVRADNKAKQPGLWRLIYLLWCQP